MIAQPMQTYAPPERRGLLAGVKACAWALQEGAGTAIPERIGNGPALTLSGTAGSEWATWGTLAPNGTDHIVRSDATQTVANYIQDICRLDNIAGQELLIGWVLEHDGDIATNEALASWGRAVATSANAGAWAINYTSSEQVQFGVWPAGGSAITYQTFPNSGTPSVTARVINILSIRGTGGNVVDMIRLGCRLDTLALSTGTVSAVDIASGGTGGPGAGEDGSTNLTIFGRRAGATTISARMGASVGSNAKVDNFWMARLDVADSSMADRCRSDMIARPREFPVSLRA